MRTSHSALVAAVLLTLCGAQAGKVQTLRPPEGKGELATAAIQQAIDAASADGGGMVSLEAGTYVTGTLLLKSNVNLHLAKGATLMGSTNPDDYQLLDEFKDGTGQSRGYALIGAKDAHHFALTGEGTIDGNGKEVLAAGKAAGKERKPFLLRLVNCEHLRVDGLTLKSSAAWTFHLSQSSNAAISNLTIRSVGAANNDGIDIDSSHTVRISGCDIDTGDDAICLKTTTPDPTHHIAIEDCTLRSRCAAVKCGTESLGDFHDIRVSRVRIPQANLAGLKFLSVDGAEIYNILAEDITMDSGNIAVFLRLGGRLKTFREGQTARPVGTMRNISIKNLTATVTSPGILISGIPDHMIENVKLENVSLTLPGGGTAEAAAAALEEKVNAYPEIRMFGPLLPASTMYVRHAKNLMVTDLKAATTRPDARPPVVLVDTENVTQEKVVVP